MTRPTVIGIATATLATACAGTYQSARTIAPGKTQVTVGVTRIQNTSDEQGVDDEQDSGWAGDLQIRHGFAERFDFGARLQRMPGVGTTVSWLSIDPKVELTPVGSPAVVSIGVPAGVMWTEEIDDGLDFANGTIVVIPSIYVGFDLSPNVEIVASPKLFYIKPDGADEEIEVGGSLGLRFVDPARSWAVQPELAVMRIAEDNESATLLSLGVAISAGD